MPNLNLKDFAFIQMWPRELMRLKEGGDLLLKQQVPQLNLPGIYVLYNGEEPYYVGKANRLFSRLHDHSNKITDRHFAHWDYFSAFLLTGEKSEQKQKLAQLEAVLIATIPRARNSSKPRFQKIRIPKTLMRMIDAKL